MGIFERHMTDYAKEVKARYIVPFSYVLALMGVVNAYIYYKLNASILVWACLISGCMAIPVRYFPNTIKHHSFYANYVIVLFCLCVYFIALYTGGVQSNAIWWLGTIPLLASFLLNAFFGTLWFALVILIFVATVYFQKGGFLPVNVLLNAEPINRMTISFTLNASLIFALCVLTELIRDKAFKEKEEMASKTFQLNQLASLGKLASGVAHEINNPLTVIRGAQLRIARMLEKQDNVDKIALAEYMDKIQKNVSRIQEVTGLMRTISANSANRELSNITLQHLLNEVIQMFSEEIEESHIEFVTAFPREEVHFEGIYTELFQAFFNIIENAVFELNESNQRNKQIQVRMDRFDRSVKISIQDNGRGIPFLVRDHIFDPFYTTKKLGSGRGLGLSFSYNVFKSNGGTIELAEATKGSHFKITLPVQI